MRNWEAERPKVSRSRVFHTAGKTYTIHGVVSPYNELIGALAAAANSLQHEDRKALQRLAWFLGVKGETQACEAIMAHIKEPEPYKGYYGMYGVPLCD